ncbi:hypothetical protein GCM10008983_05500 [Lentibacillus halophilus]|uniref:4a-hydroxytetrahydrobiopterin dehydratase n=1 Tax=Lentibacillus halophilus TaxID=295065 RepID=A0ABN0Z438_9BACI
MELLSNEAIQDALNRFPEWELVDEKWLQRKYSFRKYLHGVAFVHQMAVHAQERKHHPHIVIDHTAITVSISTLDMGGLTNVDVEMVEHFDNLFEQAEK